MSTDELAQDRKAIEKEIDVFAERIRKVATQRNTTNAEKEAVIDVCIAEICKLKDLQNLI